MWHFALSLADKDALGIHEFRLTLENLMMLVPRLSPVRATLKSLQSEWSDFLGEDYSSSNNREIPNDSEWKKYFNLDEDEHFDGDGNECPAPAGLHDIEEGD